MSEVSMIIAGDYSPKERFQDAIDNGTYKNLFPGVKDLLCSVDYSIVNFETTIPTSDSTPIDKIGSHLCAKENALEPLKHLGFDMLTCANNHFMDYGAKALTNTITSAKQYAFDYVGAGKNIHDAGEIKILELKDKRITILNACEHEFSIATEKDAGCYPLDIINLCYDIKQAKKKSDFIIIIIHGGNEHYKLPSPRMKKLYRFFIDQGADIIVNHHQHCYSGYEVYNGKPIFYGLGNFCFDSASDIKYRHNTYNYGYMVRFVLDKNISFDLIPYEQCYKVPGVYLFDEKRKHEFLNDISILNSIIADDAKLEESFSSMAKGKRDFAYRGFRPFANKVFNVLYYKGIFPSFLSKQRLKTIRAILECEAHYDVLTTNLKMEK